MFIGEHNKTHAFYSIAMDKAGNIEQAKLSADAYTTNLSVNDDSLIHMQSLTKLSKSI